MEKKNLAELSDQELLLEAKKIKQTKLFDALSIGMLIGIAVYSAVKNGFGWLSFLPLIYIPIASRNKAKYKALEEILSARNLKY